MFIYTKYLIVFLFWDTAIFLYIYIYMRLLSILMLDNAQE